MSVRTFNTPSNIHQRRIDLQPTPILDALRRCLVRVAVDFWEGPIPGPGRIEEAEESATEDWVDCWGWEGDEARIIRSAVGPSILLATKLKSQRTDVHSLPAATTTLPLPASSDALEIAASPGVPTLASRTERGSPETCVR
jgi:hypothetical protein